MTQIQSIHPYRFQGMWAFDDAATGLVRELLVLGTDEIIDELIELRRAEPDSGGYWYARRPDGKRGWLCPALFLYFPDAPAELFARAEPRRAGRPWEE